MIPTLGNSAKNPVRVCQVNNKIKKLEIAILSAVSSAVKEAATPSRNGVTREVTMAKTNLPSVWKISPSVQEEDRSETIAAAFKKNAFEERLISANKTIYYDQRITTPHHLPPQEGRHAPQEG